MEGTLFTLMILRIVIILGVISIIFGIYIIIIHYTKHIFNKLTA